MSEERKVTQVEIKTKDVKGKLIDEGNKFILEIEKSGDWTIEELESKYDIAGHSCHKRCAGLISNAAAFLI